MRRTILIAFLCLVGGAGGAYWFAVSGRSLVSDLLASDAAECSAHHLPKGRCPFCDTSLIEKEGQCAEHDVPEALCWKCRPALVAAFKAAGDWCAGHNCPESLCVICNGPRAVRSATPSHDHSHGRGRKTTTTTAAARPDEDTPRSQRPPASDCTTDGRRVTLESPEVARRVGILSAPIQQKEITHSVSCNAEIVYDGNRFVRVSPRVGGIVRQVTKDLGDRVAAGDVLAVVDSAELAAAKAEYLQGSAAVKLWEKNPAREVGLSDRGLSSQRDVLEAETKLAEGRIALARAAQRLKTLGLSDAAIDDLGKNEDTSPLLAVTAPFAGVVVERSAVIGESVEPTKPLFSIVDISRMWAMLDVPESRALQVAPGQVVTITIDALQGKQYEGRITWVSTQVDPKTRMLRARAEIDNAQGVLRANMFSRASIAVVERQPMLVVPKAAVQWDGCCNVVFVRQDDTVYEPRKVLLGYETDDAYEVREGLSAGEVVVTQGSFLLKTELLKHEIGETCCPADVARKK